MADMEKKPGTSKEHKGEMTVSEAGHKGGQKVRELIEKGEEMESKEKKGRAA